MCDSCSDTAVKIVKDDYYLTMTDLKTDVLDSEHVAEVYEEAYEELLQGYAAFNQQVFDGLFDGNEEGIQRRQEQWEQQFDALLEQVESFKNGGGEIQERAEPESEMEESEPERVLRRPKASMFTITAPPTPSPGWFNKGN